MEEFSPKVVLLNEVEKNYNTRNLPALSQALDRYGISDKARASLS